MLQYAKHSFWELPLFSLLLVEDDTRMGQLLCRFLKTQGYTVHWEKNGKSGLASLLERQPDIAILDYMLPDMDGMAICEQARPQFSGPLLMLTAADDDLNEIKALDLGMNDFLKKPFRAEVLAARLRALLRHRSPSESTAQQDLETATLKVQFQKRQVHLLGDNLELTESEYELFEILARQAGQIVTRDQIYTSLKGSDHQKFERAIDMRISTIRKKMGDSKQPYRWIETIRGKGYLLRVD